MTEQRLRLASGLVLAVGLAVSLLLAGHLVATRLTREMLEFEVDYAYVVFILWSDPWQQFKQPLLPADAG